jgi:hypothetical protein
MRGRIGEQVRAWRQARLARKITMEEASQRVARGAAFLDEADPGWYRRVDATTLELSSGSACVLGQLHGEYRLGLGRSRLVDPSSAPLASLSPSDYGFQAVYGADAALQDRDYGYLNRAWQKEVRRRQAAARGEDAPVPACRADHPAHAREQVPLAV